MVRIQILSDLHAELHPNAVPTPAQVTTGADIVVMAGDTAKAGAAVDVACGLLAAAPVLAIVAGNHEHYGTGLEIHDGIAMMRAAAQHVSKREHRDIAVLESDERVIEVRGVPVRLLGCTLWTDYALYGDPELHGPLAHARMADSRMIRGAGLNRCYEPPFVTWSELRDHCQASTAFLKEALERPHDGPTIVVTHHLPSLRSVARQYESSMLNAGFASNLDHLVRAGAALWVHGHTHTPVCWRDTDRGTLVACNPAGYMNRTRRENPAFNPRMVLTVTREDGRWLAST